VKVVINRCYGGFGLSMKALKRYCEIKGRPCHFFYKDIHADINATDKFTPLVGELPQGSQALRVSAFDVPDPSEVLPKIDWNTATQEERVASNAAWSKHSISHYDIPRNDPALVQAVEELGADADGDCAELKVVEIPDGVEFEIDEYDGMERIDEVHRSWG